MAHLNTLGSLSRSVGDACSVVIPTIYLGGLSRELGDALDLKCSTLFTESGD